MPLSLSAHAKPQEYYDHLLNAQSITLPNHRHLRVQNFPLQSSAFCPHCPTWSEYLDHKCPHLRPQLLSRAFAKQVQGLPWLWICPRPPCPRTPKSHFEYADASAHHVVVALLFEWVDCLDQFQRVVQQLGLLSLKHQSLGVNCFSVQPLLLGLNSSHLQHADVHSHLTFLYVPFFVESHACLIL